ncbi:hypothetical protein AB6A40_007993 [Gnathostoma spinigerum]|uniref:RNA helicase n=1 Tax=Gnathostoma spinigerum TaxID=75299 RepID=A0ABD6EMT5_9BILA
MEFTEVIDVERTDDVKASGSFSTMMLSSKLTEALTKLGYSAPSPVQREAIPVGLLGFDMLVQAKSGTGKTLVFALLALERLNLQLRSPQVMIVAPTREIANQISELLKKLALSFTRIGVFVGRQTTVGQDIEYIRKGVHIVVGTTGRLCHLLDKHILRPDNIRLFVLDEADKLMDETFHKDIK